MFFSYRTFIAAFTLTSGILLASGTHAATIYVNSSSGNDTTGAGTSGNPYKTFHKGYTSASAGDVLDLSGTFSWSDADETGDTATSGYTIGKNLTIRGQGASATFVQASSTPNTADRSVFTISSGVTATIKDLTLRYGKVTTSGQRGGGVSNFGTLTLQKVRVTSNVYNSTNYYGGGGLFTDTNTSITVTSSTVDNNTFNGRYYGSGGLYALQNTAIVIDGCTFASNSSTSDNPTTFPFSYADPSGGFGTFRFGAGRITNSTFTSNYTNSYGGAIQIYYKDSFTITNSTIANNTAAQGAGGILYQSEWDGYNLRLKNTILANNTGATSSNDFHAYDASSANRITDNGYNIIEFSTNKTFSGTGDLTGNQASLNLSSSLADNDSSQGTQTLALTSGSVAINAGDPANGSNSGVAIPLYDQRGASRSGTTDIGAYEYDGGGISPQYTFTYTAGANGSLSGSSTQLVNSGSNGSAVTAVPNSGYHFVNWSDSSTSNPRTDTNASGNVTVTANFEANTYTLTYTAGSGGTLSGSTTQILTHGSNGSAVTATPSAGYHFVNWSDASTTNPRTEYSVTATTSISASFALNTYTVTYTAGPNGSLSGSSTQLVEHGSSTLAVTAVGSSGYSFISWSDASTTNPRTDYNITATTTLTATFADITAPVISNIASSVGGDSADITWSTNEVASSKVIYGPTTEYGSTTLTTDTVPGVTSHTVSLTGLTACTTYHYKVVSADSSANSATSTDSTFTTANCPTQISSGGGASSFVAPASIGSGSTEQTIEMNKTGDLGIITLKGTNYLSYIGSTAQFRLETHHSQIYTLQITGLDLFTNIIQLNLNSPTQNLSLKKGEGRSLDLDQDGQFDLEITFTNVWINRAELTLKNLPHLAKISPVPTRQIALATPQPRCAFTFKRTLRLGSTGKDVQELQKCLHLFGYGFEKKPGQTQFTTYFGPVTRAALMKFQTTNKIPATGTFAALTQNAFKKNGGTILIAKK